MTEHLPGGAVPSRRNLLCVLDWGLGHAARSLALARRLEEAGEVVEWASSGSAATFLKREIPGVRVHPLPPYAVRYPSRNMVWNVAMQFPRWLLTIVREHRAVCRLVRDLSIDRLLSDSRFGCFHATVPSIFLTHQLHPITGNRLVSWLYRRHLRLFSECWVPDAAGCPLSGRLGSAEGYRNVRYIGPLSRLPARENAPVKHWVTLFLLSGPEPMRSRLETELMREYRDVPGPHLLVRGLPEGPDLSVPDNFTVRPFLTATELSRELARTTTILCRSGYSTVMDLAASGTDAHVIYVPTPGQTEQEYLAERLSGRGARSRVQGG